jgi:hypothetical protein
MSDGDDEATAGDDAEGEADAAADVTEEGLRERLDDAEEALAAAETEADLDEVEASLDDVAADLEAVDLPEPDDEDEDEEGPRAELEGRLSDLREELESQRGPYAEDVVEEVEAANATISDTRWTERGEDEIREAVESFLGSAGEVLDEEFAVDGEGEAALLDALDDVAAAVADADLDPDADAEAIGSLLEATGTLSTDLDDAQEWDDLEVRGKLAAEGFFDVLGHYKDFPPEWSAIKEHEQRGNVEMILLALDLLGSEFMEEHCVEALTRMNDERAFEAMHGRAQKRDKPAIRALGKMAAADAVETLLEYVDTDSDPQLQKATFKALGEIGSEEATQALANKLVADNEHVRPYAARALGLIGDARAVEPLGDVLADDEVDSVRAAAAWALRQIGTREALETAAEYVDERSYVVQYEAQQAADALEGEGDAKPATA